MKNIEALKEAVAKLKAVFSETKEETFMKVMTSEGVEVTIDTPEVVVGAKATIVSPEGTEVPAPEGDHVLEDGTVITVAGGEIVAVMPKVEEKSQEDEPKKDEVIEKMSAEIEAGKAAQADLIAKIQALEELINSKFSEVNKATEKVDAMFKVVSALSEIPSEQEIETEHKFSKQVSKDAKKAELADLISKYKK